MSRKVSVEIGKNGQIVVEFAGFPGEACYDEAENLNRILKELGLWAIPVSVIAKSSREIQDELADGLEDESAKRKKVPL